MIFLPDREFLSLRSFPIAATTRYSKFFLLTFVTHFPCDLANLQKISIFVSSEVITGPSNCNSHEQYFQIKPPKTVAGCHSNHFQENLYNLFSIYECNHSQLIFKQTFRYIWGTYYLNSGAPVRRRAQAEPHWFQNFWLSSDCPYVRTYAKQK